MYLWTCKAEGQVLRGVDNESQFSCVPRGD